MSECRLYEEGPQAHIMARRFDRTAEGDKRPAKPLCALAHYDYNQPAAYSCELAFKVMRDLRLPYTAAGQWQPAPACDVACAYQPGNRWTSQHQMALNGKRDGFTRADLRAVAREMNIRGADGRIDDVLTHVVRWPELAAKAAMREERTAAIANAPRPLE